MSMVQSVLSGYCSTVSAFAFGFDYRAICVYRSSKREKTNNINPLDADQFAVPGSVCATSVQTHIGFIGFLLAHVGSITYVSFGF